MPINKVPQFLLAFIYKYQLPNLDKPKPKIEGMEYWSNGAMDY